MSTDVLHATDELAAVERLHELGCTDGLPVIVPTPERVARLVLASGIDGDLSLGAMGPNLGDCTLDRLATCAVMAGCLPDHMPIVVAAAQAVIDPRFDLTEMQATTHATSPLVIVNGPAARNCGVRGGFGALGPGHRANAAIGRALRLAMINIGGGRSGSSDMALLGHGGKFTMCLAEDEANSPWAPMHTDLGFDADQSAVTVLGSESPSSIMASGDADDPDEVERLLFSLAAAFSNIANNNAALGGGQAALALNPDHAAVLARAGYSRSGARDAVVERAVVSATALDASASPFRANGRDRPVFRNAEDLLVFVAGGAGLYSAAFTTWSTGPHRNRAVTVAVETDQACVIPGLG